MTLNDEGKDKKEDYRRQPWSTYALLAMVVILAAGAIVSAGGDVVQIVLDGNTRVNITENMTDFNGTVTVNGSQICTVASGCSGGGLTSVPVINITGVNVTNGTTHTLTLRKDDGSTLGVTFDDTNTGSGGSFNVSNRDTWLNVSNSTGVINWNVTNGYPLTNSTADTCNPSTQYSVWNGTQFTCRIDSTGSGTVTSITIGQGINTSVTPITTTGTLSINYSSATLDGILSTVNFIAFSHAGSSNLTSVPTINISAFGTSRSGGNTLQINTTDGIVWNASIGSNSITLDAANITAGQLVDARIASSAAWNHAGSSNYTGFSTITAANVTAGTFGAGNYSFDGNITQTNTIGCDWRGAFKTCWNSTHEYVCAPGVTGGLC